MEAGIFDGGSPTMGFLGMGAAGAHPGATRRPATRSPNPPPQAAAGLGWLRGFGQIAFDPKIEQLQSQINTALASKGMNVLAVDGKLGPRTCGAITWMGMQTNCSKCDAVDAGLIGHALGPAGGCAGGITMPSVASTGERVVLTTTFREDLPWGVNDGRTCNRQRLLNDVLVGHGFLPIEETCTLDAATCGALRQTLEWGDDWFTSSGGNCQAFLEPTIDPGAPPEIVDPGGPEEPTETAPPKSSKAGFFMAGIASLAVVGGLYAFSKKK